MPTALLTRPVLDRVPPWVLQGASLDFDFVRHRYFQQGRPNNVEALLRTSRASVGYVNYANGIWRPVAANLPRISDKGLLVEEARTNDALWSRDMTNAAWVKVNMTAALTATGIDGIANSASMLTATAGNATTLQTITLGSQADTYSVWLKRISGSGEVDITVDNGVTWTSETITNIYQQFQVQKTAANPIFGIRLVTNGDVVAADFNQLEAGGFATSPILTTSAAVTRAADVINVTKIPAFSYSGTLFVKGVPSTPASNSANQMLAQISDGSNNNRMQIYRASGAGNMTPSVVIGGTTSLNNAIAVWQYNLSGTAAVAFSLGEQAASFNASAVETGMQAGSPTGLNTIDVGNKFDGSTQWNGHINRVAVWAAARLSDAALRAITQ